MNRLHTLDQKMDLLLPENQSTAANTHTHTQPSKINMTTSFTVVKPTTEADFPQQTAGWPHFSIWLVIIMDPLAFWHYASFFLIRQLPTSSNTKIKMKSMQSANPFGHLVLQKNVPAFKRSAVKDTRTTQWQILIHICISWHPDISTTKRVWCHYNWRSLKELRMLNVGVCEGSRSFWTQQLLLWEKSTPH